MYDTARLSYTLPTHRATVYLIGIAVSFLLRETKGKVSLNKVGSDQSGIIRQRWMSPGALHEIVYRPADFFLPAVFSFESQYLDYLAYAVLWTSRCILALPTYLLHGAEFFLRS
jgi:hypothetical protein